MHCQINRRFDKPHPSKLSLDETVIKWFEDENATSPCFSQVEIIEKKNPESQRNADLYFERKLSFTLLYHTKCYLHNTKLAQ